MDPAFKGHGIDQWVDQFSRSRGRLVLCIWQPLDSSLVPSVRSTLPGTGEPKGKISYSQNNQVLGHYLYDTVPDTRDFGGAFGCPTLVPPILNKIRDRGVEEIQESSSHLKWEQSWKGPSWPRMLTVCCLYLPWVSVILSFLLHLLLIFDLRVQIDTLSTPHSWPVLPHPIPDALKFFKKSIEICQAKWTYASIRMQASRSFLWNWPCSFLRG